MNTTRSAIRCARSGVMAGRFQGGAAAGASQQHKHLQWAPLPRVEPGPL